MATEPAAWRSVPALPSLPGVHATLQVPRTPGVLRKMLAFAGPGFLISVGYMDPGNWATDLAAGSSYNYTLLSVVMFSKRTRISREQAMRTAVRWSRTWNAPHADRAALQG